MILTTFISTLSPWGVMYIPKFINFHGYPPSILASRWDILLALSTSAVQLLSIVKKSLLSWRELRSYNIQFIYQFLVFLMHLKMLLLMPVSFYLRFSLDSEASLLQNFKKIEGKSFLSVVISHPDFIVLLLFVVILKWLNIDYCCY